MDFFAEQIVTDPDSGILHQFMEHVLPTIVFEEMKAFETAKALEEAAQFRGRKLATKYFQLWRRQANKKKMTRRGAERRNKLKASTMASLPPIIDFTALASSTNGGLPPSKNGRTLSSTNGGVAPSTNGRKRSSTNGGMASSMNGGKATETMRLFDEAEADMRQLRTELQLDATQSEYFRMKALTASAPHKQPSRKRARPTEEESIAKRPQTSRIPQHSPPPVFALPESPPQGRPKTAAERAARIAAVKARIAAALPSPPATKKTRNRTPPIANGVNKAAKRVTSSAPIPAFFSRVSRFVPRELYGKGVDALRASGFGKRDTGRGKAVARESEPYYPYSGTEEEETQSEGSFWEGEAQYASALDYHSAGEEELDADSEEGWGAPASGSASGSASFGGAGTSAEDAIEL
jgi:hypothetical protein